jgi:hypothetical protein
MEIQKLTSKQFVMLSTLRQQNVPEFWERAQVRQPLKVEVAILSKLGIEILNKNPNFSGFFLWHSYPQECACSDI